MKAIYPVKFDLPHTGLKWLEWYDKHKVFHCGYDLNSGYGNADLGNPVVAPVKLKIEYVSPEPSAFNSQNGGFGWFVIGYSEAYAVWMRFAHLNSVNVKAGDIVTLGGKIATVGNSGTTYSHLHFEVFNLKCHEIQIKHKRYMAYYPTNKPKAWVMDHYLSPLDFIDSIKQGEGWEKEAEKRVEELGLLKDVNGFVSDMSPHKVLQLACNLYDKLKP